MSQSDSASFTIRGRRYKVGYLDEPDVDTDPTILIFRDDEEVAIATIHLDPTARCTAWPGSVSHVVARAGEEDE